ncbi:NADPH--cytochrome P450 reductase-like [Varroa destructor]|uniref:NADPH--cytochrome P450 reductase n=1 Tax=Varroa destructor TaxID=109461 RepID=A0A7M7KLC1_VARDE|nr:NADPH--cytochrome P450 reductase-like [Varroa destructor]
MSDPAAGAAEAAVETSVLLVGAVDVAILATLVGAAYWWFFLRKKDDLSSSFDAAAIKSFSIEGSMNRERSSGSFISKMRAHGRNVVVFYGSQTGTAEEFAARLAKEAVRYGLKAMVADPEECEMEELQELKTISNHLAIFCMATYGEGDPTDNCQEFYQWLQEGSVNLPGLNYAVFALGNKTYEHYNAMGRYVDSRLEQLGAYRVFALGEGDDDANIEEDFITWKDDFWASVCEQFGLEVSASDLNMRQYQLIVHEKGSLPEDKIYHGEVARLTQFTNQRPPFDLKNPYLAEVVEKRDLYNSERSCLHMEFDIVGSKMRYETGDHMGFYPTNDSALVEELGKLLNVDLDQVITLRNTDEDSSKKHPFPCPCSYRTALSHYVDICTAPRTHVLKELSEYCSDEVDKAKLKLMSSSSAEGKAEYAKWVQEACRSIVHILEDLPSCKPPLDLMLEFMPRLQPRYYSISSSSKVFSERIHITAVKVDYTTPTNRHITGVATGQMAITNLKTRLPIFVRRSQFKLPTRPTAPIIMVGPGTGLAPFRGFLQERQHQRVVENKQVGESHLFYGCRKRNEDFLYPEELNAFVADGTCKMYVAFSREQEHKIYVTHLLAKEMDLVWDVIGVKGGHFYVCGDARTMARDVYQIVLKTLREKGGMSSADAEKYLKKMESQRRYCTDVWS